ncbi:MAG: acetyl-CoA carboxylase biotin carboxyl carrier protein [Planctomycetes bacterium]|nr:acetyl-CoA carboxylase biotin carboxyl carrier protein [Planctomycetota bacterium]
MNLEELKKLVRLMNSNDLVEIEIESGDSKVRLKKAGANAPTTFAMPPMMAAPAAMPQPAPFASMPVAASAKLPESVEGDSVTFNSPMVGTFYSAPSPTADPFVKAGDKVSPKTVLCIIEAMKVMNEIAAEMHGEILEVLVGNGEAVEYGQPLFTIKPKK